MNHDIPLQSTSPRRMRLCALVFAVLALLSADSSKGTTIQFDPDGAAAGNGASAVATFDFKPSNALLQGLGTLLSNKVNQSVTYFAQSRINQLFDANNDTVPSSGLDTTFELTMVMGFSAVANVAGTAMQYQLAASPTVNFFKIFYDAAANANELAGTGFDDGTLILSGTALEAVGGFNRTTGTSDLDGFNTNDYPGVTTRRGSSGAWHNIEVNFADPTFFFGSLPAAASFAIYSGSNTVPFTTVDPSAKFSDGLAPNIIPNLGAVNGQGTDFQTLSDPTASFEVIPEPSSCILGAIGAVGVLALLRRRWA